MKTKRFIDRVLKEHFFQPVGSESLSLFRFLYCSLLIWRLTGDLVGHLAKFGQATWNPIPLFELFGVGLMSPDSFRALHYVLVASLALTAVGAFTRVAAHVAWISFFVYMGTYLGFSKTADSSYVYHSKNIVVFILFILAISPGVAVWGVDGWRRRGWRWRLPDSAHGLISNWPSQLIKLMLGLAYFGSGYCKQILWSDGYTLQGYLVHKHLLLGADTQWGHWLSQHYWLCLGLGVATLILELTFFLIVFFPRLTWPYVFGGLSFHTSVWLTMKISFFPYFGFVYAIFLDWPTLTRLTAPVRWAWARVRSEAFAQAPAKASRSVAKLANGLTLGDSVFARRVILGMAGMLFFCVIARVESWPFTDYRVFEKRNHVSRVQVYRFAIVKDDGQLEWIAREDHPISPTALNTRCRRGDDEVKAQMLAEVADNLATRGVDSARVALVERTVLANVDSDKYTVVDRPVMELPLPGIPTLDPFELSLPAAHIAEELPASVFR